MLGVLVLVLLRCNMLGTTLRAKRGSNLCATAQKVMRDGPIALAALSLHLSFSGWPYGPTCHTPQMQYVLCANEMGLRKTMYFTVLDSKNLMRECSFVKCTFPKRVFCNTRLRKCYARLHGFFLFLCATAEVQLLAVELLLATIWICVYARHMDMIYQRTNIRYVCHCHVT